MLLKPLTNQSFTPDLEIHNRQLGIIMCMAKWYMCGKMVHAFAVVVASVIIKPVQIFSKV